LQAIGNAAICPTGWKPVADRTPQSLLEAGCRMRRKVTVKRQMRTTGSKPVADSIPKPAGSRLADE
jgi:hypothetical protein